MTFYNKTFNAIFHISKTYFVFEEKKWLNKKTKRNQKSGKPAKLGTMDPFKMKMVTKRMLEKYFPQVTCVTN